MDKTYQPKLIEPHWYQVWEDSSYFTPSKKGTPYCIMIPPPNVTGTLHMGHGFQHTLMDALIRYHRMLGDSTLWQVGTDHAGIATQMVVERQLKHNGEDRMTLGREKFIERVWDWKQQSGDTITKQMRRLGNSVDWSRERFTMDEGLSTTVREIFIRLHDEGLIYRGKRLVNWDPKLLTAVSDLEVLTEEAKGSLWHIRYPICDSDQHLIVATTRPETMVGDVAVAVHPTDERYQAYIGKQLELPLCDRTIPIIADDYVDPSFGSGCVKITPAHDFNDYEIGQRHQLEAINILTPDAHINDNAPADYRGLDRFAAREQIVADLASAGLLEKTIDHVYQLPRGDRSGAIIEPYLTDQWFVKATALAPAALDAVRSGKIKFIPDNWANTYYQWLENIEDWCISRQLWWGHRIPAWYDDAGNSYVGYNEADVRGKHQLNDSIQLRQDDDVLDTWFSSAFWPFSTLGWPEKTEAFTTFYPSNVLITGFDIIFFWVARMIMMGLKFTGRIPFQHIYITGLIRDSEGQKMSKSKGNVIDPIDLIDGIGLPALIEKRTFGLMQPHLAEKISADTTKQFPAGIEAHGCDALRFTYCALANTGRDIRFDISRLAGYRNFCNKIWNAARYVLINTEQHDQSSDLKPLQLSIADEWIMSRLEQTIAAAHKHFNSYRFDLLAQTIYEFIWHEYCDWYLELSKFTLNNPATTPPAIRGTRHTLLVVLECLMRLAHPIMPFLTEEIWQKVAPMIGNGGASVMLQPYPIFNEANINQDAEQTIAWLQQVTLGVRNIRGEMNISPAKAVPVLLRKGCQQDKIIAEHQRELLCFIAKLTDVDWLEPDDTIPPAATALANELEILIPMAGLIDKAVEVKRLEKEITKLTKNAAQIQQKLANPNFVDKAPSAVVAKEKQRAEKSQLALQQLQAQLQRINAL